MYVCIPVDKNLANSLLCSTFCQMPTTRMFVHAYLYKLFYSFNDSYCMLLFRSLCISPCMHGILRLILQSANFFLLSLIVQHIVSPIYCNTIAFQVQYTTSMSLYY